MRKNNAVDGFGLRSRMMRNWYWWSKNVFAAERWDLTSLKLVVQKSTTCEKMRNVPIMVDGRKQKWARNFRYKDMIKKRVCGK